MKPSEKLWITVGKWVFGLLVIFAFHTAYVMHESSQDFDVPVTITGKYARGYHHKHSIGENFYVNCYNETYGHLTINVGFNTYNTLDKGERTTFNLDKFDIDRYSSSDDRLVTKYMVIYMMISVFVFIILLILIIMYISDIVIAFNKHIDKQFDENE